ncbi:hypothetical protein CY34DRAFT_476582 [Suillus luteus UH-Slu-Lm8-n1]|uniref:Unplaced genomic scaffold CY34scaffold_344, whole genome shotgun sequence n=1 Tax=Suillus luteus UH-Slu-Lm8-n1 TaxID=930992 RepID=A0A0D0AG45_9AGAM|nr:hypothetical protein CY34DRAFT_476582 [Suillus luteus UH-Slu-Lm8-n1]
MIRFLSRLMFTKKINTSKSFRFHISSYYALTITPILRTELAYVRDTLSVPGYQSKPNLDPSTANLLDQQIHFFCACRCQATLHRMIFI